ncbi:MAG: hypothetical protein JWQ26_1413 [Modestobacter sp.]|jgi:hypothetical protein|nr:hypothetical protein [Modestobacter sp.]
MLRVVPSALEWCVREIHLPRFPRSPRSLRSPRASLTAAAVLATTLVVLPVGARADDNPAEVGPGDTVVGELVRAYDDPGPAGRGDGHGTEDDGSAGLLSWVRTAPGENVRVPAEDVEDIRTGSTVQVTVGAAVLDEAAAQGLEPAHDVLGAEVLAPAPAPTTAPATAPVNHQVTIVLMAPAGAPADDTTLAEAQAVVAGSVADFWSEQSGGQARFGVVAGWDWAPATVGCEDPFALWAEAQRRAGWSPGAGKHLLVFVPDGTPGCSYGLGTVGSGIGDGGLAYVQAAQTSVIAHEFGHNLGLGHSSVVQCDRAVEAGTCRTVGYGDYYDVMGISWTQVGSLNAAQASRLGVLPAAQQVSLTAASPAGSYEVRPIAASSGLRALRLTDPQGTAYWLEYRQASGRDSWLGSSTANWPGLQSGMTLRKAAGPPDTALLLDGSPSAAADWPGDLQSALPIGRAVTLSGGSFTVTVSSVTPTSAVVHVTTSTSNPPVPLPAPGDPIGAVDEVARRGGDVVIRGWAYDPDALAQPVPISVSVDGAAATTSPVTAVSESFFETATAMQGFVRVVRIPAGTHRLCIFAVNGAGPGATASLGCRTVT